MNLSQVIVEAVLSEKSVKSASSGKYTFIVHNDATKVDVKQAIKEIYGAEVAKVNIFRGLPKFRLGRNRKLMQKRAADKRAVITLKEGQSLDTSKINLSS